MAATGCWCSASSLNLLSLLRARIELKKWDYCYLDGGCSAKSRQESILRFRHEPVPLFLISLKAGGTGLNLTQADTVLHLDPWWNPAVEDQASDWAHRMGQTQPVTVYRLVCEQTVEEKIVALHDEKRALADGLLSGQSEVRGLDVESLRALLMAGAVLPAWVRGMVLVTIPLLCFRGSLPASGPLTGLIRGASPDSDRGAAAL